MAERRGYRVEGRVQGVGFRWWVRRIGLSLGLRGNVWNRPDGSVEVQASGSLEDLGALEEALWKGPPISRVDAVEAAPPGGAVPESGFLVEGS
ncbi:MAG: acylphosphatase [Planctomycetota bacterium]|jgi:acylphosphatase